MLLDLGFFLALLAAAAAVRLARKPRGRRIAVLAIGTAFLVYLQPAAAAVAIVLGACAAGLAAEGGVLRRTRLALWAALLLAALVGAKLAHDSWSDAQWIAPLGFSYLVFKLVSFAIEARRSAVPGGVRLGDSVLYATFFPIFLAGPIERFERLVPRLREWPMPSKADFIDGTQRILEGLFKKLVIADGLAALSQPVLSDPSSYGVGMRAAVLAATSWRFYLDFAGYSDVAIGSARILGVTVMENFDWPYAKTNIGQFWRSWHISLSDWIRDYVFYPLSRMGRSLFWSIVCAIVAMVVFGLWHGLNAHFAIWGAYQGAGIGAFQLFQQAKRKSAALRRWTTFPGSRWAAIALTFLFVTYGWTFFLAGLGTPLPLWGAP
jgi:alginate O-acetyltransferase complex protein AlgI